MDTPLYTVALITMAALTAPAMSAWTVDPSGGGDATTIQGAVDLASSGDFIDVHPGIYTDDDGDGVVVEIGALSALDVKIRAIGSGVIIDGQSSAQGMVIWDGDVSIEGIEFLDCSATILAGGGGVLAQNNGDSIDILSCTFVNCENSLSSGIGGSVSVYSTTSSSPITFTITDSSFFTSTASTGGGVFLTGANAAMSNCVFDGCSASNGGAMEIRGGTTTMNSCSFTDNTASNGGAIRVNSNSADVTMTLTSFTSNESSWGSAVNLEKGMLAMLSCDVDNNVATRSGALHLRDGVEAEVSNTFFSRNEAIESGYDIYHAISGQSTAVLTLSGSTFCDHLASGEIEIAYTDGGGNDLGNWCCPGDIDDDGDVDAGDLTNFLFAYGNVLVTSDDREDVARNGGADVLDLLGMLQTWGTCE
jgi:hypothetical protein